MIETRHYSDGTSATGTAPLPDLSPDQQTAMEAAALTIERASGGKREVGWDAPNTNATEMETCDRCMGSGYQGHPDDPAGKCMKCDGQGGVSNTADLTARLRAPISAWDPRELANAAADEIERLRAALAEEAKFWERHGPGASL